MLLRQTSSPETCVKSANPSTPPAGSDYERSFLAQDTHLAADQGIKDSSVHWQADVTRFYFTSPFLI